MQALYEEDLYMIYSRQYSRQFILLKSVDISKANGRCVIEIKNSDGRIIVNTYSLQPNIIYSVCFVLKGNENKAIKIGEIITDKQKTISFNPDDIEGNKIEDISCIAVIKSDGKKPILAGFTDEYVDLKNGIRVMQNEKIIACKSENKDDAEKENTQSIKKEIKKMPQNIDFMEMFDKFRKDMEELEKMALAPTPIKCDCPECKKEEKDLNTQKNEFTVYLDYIKNVKEKINPFKSNTFDIEWYSISPCDLSPIENIPIQIIINPDIAFAYKKYGHIIFGIYTENENEKYIVGVPCDSEDTCNSKYFKQFIPADGKSIKGYKLCYF